MIVFLTAVMLAQMVDRYFFITTWRRVEDWGGWGGKLKRGPRHVCGFGGGGILGVRLGEKYRLSRCCQARQWWVTAEGWSRSEALESPREGASEKGSTSPAPSLCQLIEASISGHFPSVFPSKKKKQTIKKNPKKKPFLRVFLNLAVFILSCRNRLLALPRSWSRRVE